jgi:hypothetical protein
MPVFVKNSKTVLFVHIPKTAGTTLSMIFKRLGWKEFFSIRGENPQSLDFVRCSPQHFHAELLEQIFKFDAFDEIVTICRDPFSRIKSEYYWQKHIGITSFSPKKWFRKVQKQFLVNPYIYDNHIRPQHEFIKIPQIKVYSIEQNGLRLLSKHLCKMEPNRHLRFLFFHFIKQLKKKKSHKIQYVESAFSEIQSEIKQFYQKDYKIFNYNMNF